MQVLSCPNCGSNLEIKEDGSVCHCAYCGSTILLEGGDPGRRDSLFVVVAGILREYKGPYEEIIIPTGIKAIGADCFAGMSLLKSVSLPEGLVEIQRGAFEGCTGLEEVLFPDSLQVIGDHAFRGAGLRRVTLPGSLNSLGCGAFMNCQNLEEAVLPHNDRILYKKCFYACSRLERVEFEPSDFFPSFVASEHTVRKGDKRPTLYDAFPETPFLQALRKKVTERKCIICDGMLDKRHTCAQCGTTYSFGQAKGCFIATAVYGSYDCPQVRILRRYRDCRLDSSWWGRLFVSVYYRLSPRAVRLFGGKRWFVSFSRHWLDRITVRLKQKGFDDTPYEDRE